MADEGQKVETVEVPDEPKAPKAADLPTRENLKEQGWSAAEVDRAEKRGMVAKTAEPAKDKPKEPEKSAGGESQDKTSSEPKDKKPGEPETLKPAANALPDFTLPPEKEQEFLRIFGPGTVPRAMYFRMKNERAARQSAEVRVRELEAQLKALEEKPAAPQDESGEDPDDQPITLGVLKRLRQQEAEVFEKRRVEQAQRQARVAAANGEQEEFARATLLEYEQTVERAKEVINNLDTLIPEPYRRAKVVALIRQMQEAAVMADKIGPDGYTAAMIAYEIGQMHPEHGQKPKETGSKDPKDGVKAPDAKETLKRMEEVTTKRPSSASVASGNGRRTVSVEDVGLAELSRMSAQERLRFRERYPERWARLVRG